MDIKKELTRTQWVIKLILNCLKKDAKKVSMEIVFSTKMRSHGFISCTIYMHLMSILGEDSSQWKIDFHT